MFKLRKTEETVNKTFRISATLVDKMNVIAQNEGISLNSFVVQCCEYAVEQLENPKSDENPKTKKTGK